MQPLCGQAGFGGGGLRGGSSCFWEFPKIVGAFLGVPILKTIVDGGSPMYGNYHIACIQPPCP